MFLFYVLLSFYVNAEKNGESNSTSVQEEFIEPSKKFLLFSKNYFN